MTVALIKTTICTAVLCIGFALPALAQGLPNAKAAQKQLFSTRSGAVIVRVLEPDLMGEIQADKIKKSAPYYSAISVSPATGFAGEAAFAALNFHSIEAAVTSALAQCNEKRAETDEACVILMEIVPAKYKVKKSFQLNVEASTAFKKEYRRAKAPKAFAVSESTGLWGFQVKSADLATARAQAIAICAAKVDDEVNDCTVVSED